MKKLALLFIPVTILIFCFIDSFTVPTESMTPTISVGAKVILNKWRPDKIKKGDVIGFYYPNKQGTQYIKRVVGMVGEMVYFEKGKYSTTPFSENNHAYKTPSTGNNITLNADNIDFYKPLIEQYEGIMVNQLSNRIFIDGKESGTYTFKYNYFFAQGDNTDNSVDSRVWGLVSTKNIIGTLLIQY
jgi:signal peptidase I